MASRAINYWRSMVARMAMARSYATSTAPRMKPIAPTIDASHPDHSNFKALPIKGEFAPVMVVMGMVVVAMAIGTHTAKQQLMHSPTVYINKKKRETMPEVSDPDGVLRSADKFVNKSFFRKVAHIQENKNTLPDPTRPNPFTTYTGLEMWRALNLLELTQDTIEWTTS
ncbi:uncharacterized protein LOC107413276 isoform X1 [Ziziphus jujuba]|nr:uncharacterized protein LOC107413276 isoform X1 [Ziziphus jujuba]